VIAFMVSVRGRLLTDSRAHVDLSRSGKLPGRRTRDAATGDRGASLVFTT